MVHAPRMEDFGSGQVAMPTRRLVSLGLAIMAAVAAPSFLVSAWLGKAWGLGLALFLALWVAGIAATRHLALPIAGAFACAVALLLGRAAEVASVGGEPWRLPRPEVSAWESVRDGARFDDAHVEPSLSGVHSMEVALGLPAAREVPGPSAWIVAPVVGTGWTAQETVRLWALCHGAELDACRASWARPLRAVAPSADAPRPGACARAIADAEAAHGITSAPGAPCVLWVEDPLALRRRLLARPLLGAVAVVVLWVLGVPLVRAYARRRRRRGAREEAGARAR